MPASSSHRVAPCAAALEWLQEGPRKRVSLGLATMRRLTKSLGLRLGGDCAPVCIHVAGTNGKGSVCAMAASICHAGGFRTGLFTSPPLVRWSEHVRVDGRMIGEAETVSGLEAIRSLVGGWEPQPTSFEITTALALAHFASSRCQVMVIEAGLGGRLDATNIVTPAVSVLTPIDLDHQQHLGSSLAQIAAEKAGIIKPGVPVVSARQPDEAAAVIRRIAFERRAPLHEVGEPVEHLAIGLAGSYQRWNAALAIRALEHSGLDVPPDAIQRGLASVTWPGRFQRIGERIVLDGAHNPAAARCLAQTWREVFGETKATLVLGVLQDKNLRGICETLLPIASRIIAVAVQNPRSSSARELCDVIRDIAPEFPIAEATSLPGAIGSARAQSDPILVAGSLFLVGETLAFLHDEGAREVSVQ